MVVALTGAPGGEDLVRRASRMAHACERRAARRARARRRGARRPAVRGLLERHRALLADLGGEYHEVVGADVARALVEFARAENATQLVLGASRRSRWSHRCAARSSTASSARPGPSTSTSSRTRSEGEPETRAAASPRGFSLGVSRQRQAAAAVFAIVGLPLLTLFLTHERDHVSLGSDLLLYLLLVVVIAATGGRLGRERGRDRRVPDRRTGTSRHRSTPSRSPRTRTCSRWSCSSSSRASSAGSSTAASAARDRGGTGARRSGTLVRLAAALLAEDDPLPSIMQQLIARFALAVGRGACARTAPERGRSRRARASRCSSRRRRRRRRPAARRRALRLRRAEPHRRRPAGAERVRGAARGRAREPASCGPRRRPPVALAEANELRTALLPRCRTTCARRWRRSRRRRRACSPTTSHLDEATMRQFLQTIDEETDRLNALVGNLLDMSRLQAGALQLASRAVGTRRDRRAAHSSSLGDRAGGVVVDVPRRCRGCVPMPRLLERAVANVVDNAIAWSPAGATRARSRPRVVGDRVDSARDRPRAGHRRRPTASRCSSRSSGSATGAAGAAVSASGSRSRAASPRRWTASCGRGHARRRNHDDRSASGRRDMSGSWWSTTSRRCGARCGIILRGARLRGRAGRHRRARALDLAARDHPDVVVLDLGLPAWTASRWSRGLRGWSTVPIIVLSARDAEPDKVAALDAGADDYVTKPFGDGRAARPPARRAAARRADRAGTRRSSPTTSRSTSPPSDPPATATRCGSRRPSGSSSRSSSRNPGKLVTQQQLLQQVWGPEYERETNYLRVYMARSAASSNPTRRDPATSSPSRAWATGSSWRNHERHPRSVAASSSRPRRWSRSGRSRGRAASPRSWSRARSCPSAITSRTPTWLSRSSSPCCSRRSSAAGSRAGSRR